MFEEVPRARRGLARLTARHVVLGPFVVGGGVLLAAIGGGVAVAATMITASTIRASDVPPRPAPHPVVTASSHHAPAHRAATASPSGHRAGTGTAGARPSTIGPATSQPPAAPSSSRLAASVPAARPSSDPYASGPASAGPSGTAAKPAGNALIYVTGYDQAGQRLQFEYAVDSPGAGPGGSDLYRVESTRQYSAGFAADLTITSGGQLCPPAGSRCSLDQLIAGAGAGFYAIAAIDPADQLHSVIEVDNAASGFGAASTAPASTAPASTAPAPTATAAPTGIASPRSTSS